jgi:hypothetical protein
MKTDLGKCKKLLDSGLSLLCVGDNKVPNFPWKKRQTEAYPKSDFEKDYNYSGGIIRKDGTEIPPTNGIGIVTGFNGIEVIDIDLKILPSLKLQQDFWNEFTSFLKDNIDDFDSKFVIYKTVNNGYHIIYKCKVIGGNEKIAKLKGHDQAIIETRGVGGYVFIYENQVSKKSYTDIQEISEMDREVLFGICKYYNYVGEIEPIVIEVKPESEKEDASEISIDISVWDDYNQKTTMMDILSSDFSIVRNLTDKLIIKRSGAESAHSGYIYKDTGCMYLFTTGTLYPSEKLISPFAAYTYKNHNGDFSKSAKELYQQGFGSRVVKKIKELNTEIPEEIQDIDFPIEVFPLEIQNYIRKCNETLDSSIDYMGCSMLWMISVIMGNSIKIQVKPGWKEPAVVWISVLGKAGIGKTPSIQNIVSPLMEINNREQKKYVKQYEKYEAFMELDKKERLNTEEIKKPKKSQFIANDITFEALVDLHEENKNSVGVFKDELAGWFKDMNKYRSGSDLESWLMSWNGTSISLNRKSAKSSFVDKPFIPVLGGIQPGIMDQFYTDENKDSGFLDRMLFCLPDLMVDEYNDDEMDDEIITWYSDYMVAFYDNIRRHLVKYDADDNIVPLIAKYSPDAKTEWIRIFNKVTAMQNSDEENEYMKSMLPKQKSYIPRFAALINTFSVFSKSGTVADFNTISKESILAAEKLSDYFILMAKKIKVSSSEISTIKRQVKFNEGKSAFEVFQVLYKRNSKLNKTEVAEVLGISRKTVYEFIKKCNGHSEKVSPLKTA